MPFRFNIPKTIQATGVLLHCEPSHQMSRLRLLKLLYIADRESLRERARPITGDRAVAMEHGPVPSGTYRLVKGEDFHATDWQKYFRSDHRDIVLIQDPGVGELTRLEIAKLHEISRRHEGDADYDIAMITHAFAEWEKNKPTGSNRMNDIPFDDLLAAIDLSHLKDKIVADAQAEAAAHRVFRQT